MSLIVLDTDSLTLYQFADAVVGGLARLLTPHVNSGSTPPAQ
jgi:hypothetical protein